MTGADLVAFSFGGSKLLTAGRGGAVTSNSAMAMQRIKIFNERGNDAFPLSQLQAAALLPQFEELDLLEQERAASLRRFADGVSAAVHLRYCGPREPDWHGSVYKIPFRVSADVVAHGQFDKDFVIQALVAEGIAAVSGFAGFVKRSARRCRRISDLAQAQAAVDETILVHHAFLTASPIAAVERVAAGIRKVDGFLQRKLGTLS